MWTPYELSRVSTVEKKFTVIHQLHCFKVQTIEVEFLTEIKSYEYTESLYFSKIVSRNSIPCVKYSEIHIICAVWIDFEKVISEIGIIIGMIFTRKKSSIRPDFFLVVLTPTFWPLMLRDALIGCIAIMDPYLTFYGWINYPSYLYNDVASFDDNSTVPVAIILRRFCRAYPMSKW